MVIEIIGDFPEGEAREFLKTCVMPAGLPDDAWARVYQVRLFHILALLSCA
jgi:hypothetical protein